MGLNKNKATRQNQNRKIVGAIKKHLSAAVTLEGVKYTPARLAKMFQEGIDIADATDVANQAWHASVATEQAKTQEMSGVQTALRHHVTATYGEASTAFTDFGFTPRTAKAVDAETKAAAVKKRAATRDARHTMGKRKKAKIKGVVTPSVIVPTTPAATATAPATTSQANGTPSPAKAVASA